MSEVEIELHIGDHEIAAIEDFLRRMRHKWTGTTNSIENIRKMVQEMEEGMFALGFQIRVASVEEWLASPGPHTIPKFAIWERVEPLDLEAHEQAVKAGVADEFWERYRTRAKKTDPGAAAAAGEGHSH